MIEDVSDTTVNRSRSSTRMVRAASVHTAIADGSIAFGADLADGDLIGVASPWIRLGRRRTHVADHDRR